MSAATARAEPWDFAPALVQNAADRLKRCSSAAWYRIGDLYLQVTTDHAPLQREFDNTYGDCAASPPAGSPRLHCAAGLLPGGKLLCLLFDGPQVPDPLEVALSPYRFLRRPRYVSMAGPLPGWRQLLAEGDGGQFQAASDGRILLIDPAAAPPEFAIDCIVGMAQAAQPGVLYLHAGSVGIAGAGTLICGSTGGGKSTTTLALALRGHAFLGDDVAVIRLASREILPFPKSAGMRDGPLTDVLQERLRASRHVLAENRWNMVRTVVRVGDLFPGSLGRPLPLRYAFLLDGFGEQASVADYQPQLADVKRLQALVSDASPSWGLSPGRDLMNFLVVVNLLSGLRCYRVRLGSPSETAELIETTVNATCHST